MPTELKPGDAAPAFNVESDRGGRINLADLKGQWVVLYWYPKDDTPGCTIEACEIRDSWGLLEGEAKLFGISMDSVDSHQKFRDKYSLPFPLLADTDHSVAEAYGVYGKKTFAGREYMGLDRATFVIDPEGKIARVWAQVNPAGHALEILTALKELKAA